MITQSLSIPEHDLFTILAHPIRRRILKTIYAHKLLTFSTMSSWDIKTGTLYFHLKELDGLITQDEDKRYILTPQGQEVCEWFVGTDNEVRVIKFESYALASRKILHHVFNRPLVQVMLITIMVLSYWVAYQDNLLLMGPFIIATTMPASTTLMLNFLILLVEVVVTVLLLKVLAPGQSIIRQVYPALLTLLSGFLLSYLAVIVLWFVAPIYVLKIEGLAYLFMLIVSQVFAGLVFVGSFLRLTQISAERAVLSSLSLVYVSMVIFLVYLL